MASGTINYNYSPNDPAWQVSATGGIKSVTIVEMDATVRLTSTAIEYVVRYQDGSTANVAQADLYALLADALTAYGTLLSA